MIFNKGMDEIMAFIDPDRDGILTRDEVIFMIEETFRVMKNNIRYWRFYFTSIMQPSVLKLVQPKLSETVGSVIHKLKKYFESRGGEDPGLEAIVFGAFLDGISMNYIIDPEHFPLEKVKKRIIELYK